MIAGILKASVFPLPVSAIATQSFPESAHGQAAAWTGVGLEYEEKKVWSLEGMGRNPNSMTGRNVFLLMAIEFELMYCSICSLGRLFNLESSKYVSL